MMRLNSRQKEPHRAPLGDANSEINPFQDSQYAKNCLAGLKPNWSTPPEPPQVSNVQRQERATWPDGVAIVVRHRGKSYPDFHGLVFGLLAVELGCKRHDCLRRCVPAPIGTTKKSTQGLSAQSCKSDSECKSES
jgi:hypothetical protein